MLFYLDTEEVALVEDDTINQRKPSSRGTEPLKQPDDNGALGMHHFTASLTLMTIGLWKIL